MTPEQTEGLTKARLICNAGLDAGSRFSNNAEYAFWVAEMAGLDNLPDSALDSYAAQHSDKSIAGLEEALAKADADNEQP